MVFKINVSHKGKTIKIETESESLIRSKIGDTVKGESFSPELEGYELEITGTSDKSGFPGIKGHAGMGLRKVLLTRKDKAMNNTKKGLRLKKSIRGEEISEKISQINFKVIKEGKKKLSEFAGKKAEGEAPAEPEKKGEVKETEKAEETKDSTPAPQENKELPKKEEKPAEEKAEDKPAEEKEKEAAQPDKEPKASEQEKKELAEPNKEKTE